MAKINWFLSLLFIALLINLKLPYATSHFLETYCLKTNTYAGTNSAYPDHLNTLLKSLSSAAATSTTGFATATVGNSTNDAVYGLFLCRGDLTPSLCSECITTAIRDRNTNMADCPRSKVGIIWYEECMVRYDHRNFLGKMDQEPWTGDYWNLHFMTGNQTWLRQILEDTMKDLAVKTSRGGSKKKYATMAVNLTSSQTLYVLEQCTPDLSASDCEKCLNAAIMRTQVRQSWEVFQASCNLRFEVYKFFNGTVNVVSSSSLPSNGSISSSSKASSDKRRAKKVWIAVFVLVILGLFTLLATVRFWFLHRRKTKKSENYDIKCADCLQLDYDIIEAATENFSEAKKLGEGTTVSKGLLPSGQEIAVKRLFKNRRDTEQEFNNEVLLLANLQHRNLVKLLGFCITKDIWLLVHEFQPNESLDWFLCDPVKRAQLDWGTRHNIITGIARGLLYLHEDSQLMVIHRGLKASNILLDVEMNPKISNFRRASRVRLDELTRVTNNIKITPGYMPPEYVLQGHFPFKSDVFVFGVLVLEIINGQMINNFSDREHEDNLLSYAWRKWLDGESLDLADKTIEGIGNHTSQIMNCIKIALLCVQEDPASRPTMSTVVFMLNSNIDAIAEPSKPAFINHNDVSISSSNSGQSNQGSVNEVSISMVDPR